MNWWQTKVMPISQGLPQNEDQSEENVARIIYSPANHFSRRTLFDDKKALWGSWVVIGSKGSKFWFGGDTAYSDVFKQIGKRYGPFDISAIPIGMIYINVRMNINTYNTTLGLTKIFWIRWILQRKYTNTTI